jgi:hypothetical protein
MTPPRMAAAPPPDMPESIERYDQDGVRDFSAPRKKVVFRMEGDLFHGVPDLPGEAMLELAEQFSQIEQMKIGDPRMRELVHQQMRLVLVDEDYEVYARRLSDRKDPISLSQTLQVIPWIVEQYGLRPTQPSSDSAPGSQSEGGGTSSTVEPYSPGSTPRDYLRPASLT